MFQVGSVANERCYSDGFCTTQRSDIRRNAVGAKTLMIDFFTWVCSVAVLQTYIHGLTLERPLVATNKRSILKSHTHFSCVLTFCLFSTFSVSENDERRVDDNDDTAKNGPFNVASLGKLGCSSVVDVIV